MIIRGMSIHKHQDCMAKCFKKLFYRHCAPERRNEFRDNFDELFDYILRKHASEAKSLKIIIDEILIPEDDKRVNLQCECRNIYEESDDYQVYSE